MAPVDLSWLVVPAAIALPTFLAFSSQYLFLGLDPGPLSRYDSMIFNVIMLCMYVCFARAGLTDPGRVPKIESSEKENLETNGSGAPHRWCRVCEQRKPPRSHHCRRCKRCIPKMDHHCPWTANCVSHRTFPHFIRFVFYSFIALVTMEYHLYVRFAYLWENRHISSYFGPSAGQLAHLFILAVLNSFTMLAIGMLLGRSVWSLLWNTTAIEEWEIERHEVLLRRAKVNGGYLDGPDGAQIKIKRQEYPFDIGIWKNVKQGMGTGNPLAWFWPFGSTDGIHSGLEFETNGMEDPSIGWPPPDPDRIPRKLRRLGVDDSYNDTVALSAEEQLEQFRKRQAEDLKRWEKRYEPVHRRQPFHKRYSKEAIQANDTSSPSLYVEGDEEGEEGWKDSEGQSLKDFGLDEEAEFYDEDNIPLGEILRRRRQKSRIE